MDNKKKTHFAAAHERSGSLFVTRPDLPPLDEFVDYLKKIWDRRWLTNNGLFHQELEQALADYLGVQHLSLFANGTLALVSALQVLRITGEVITTPYSFVATTHALHWNGITPVFCDIDPNTMNIDHTKIEALITPKTTAILPVHVYGIPANVREIQRIADIYGLRVIYDACHAFGVRMNNESILNFGDLSVLSFHATKIFTTMEGGAIITNNPKIKKRIDYIKNFGFANETTVMAPGINGKMNEMQAALGILQLKYVDEYIRIRKKVSEFYERELESVSGVRYLERRPGIRHNYAYFPIFVNEKEYGISRDELYFKMKEKNIYCRRYFYPLISEFPMYRNLPSAGEDKLPVATRVSREVIALPLYPRLSQEDQRRVIDVIKTNARQIDHYNLGDNKSDTFLCDHPLSIPLQSVQISGS
ncbi:MAG: DegT/DnrJ/EryC1/StrS family aminotransferase [Deltaproteobacteria bacterium]|nr:DegT/DnrJ/EryC1/StrS family aminotransferase [Deltaproteobacteria bacterium]MBW1929218.1 DegT/DnrJ/EryC1/StrS family aminotransferase [Deltaproteobacteria bacterium]MBW2025239.1 DegT/DnrJ/EryC1/StrS family aminotransferase [Deltaproteobacteria bacterium]